MKMPPFKLYSPSSVDEAIQIAKDLQSKQEDFDWISGGTDLIPNYKWHLNPKKNVISLGNISQLTELTQTTIGGMVRLQDLAESEFTHPVLAKSANSIASIMIRRSGTWGEIFVLIRDVIGITKQRIGEKLSIGAINVIVAQELIAESFQIKIHYV